MREKPYILIIDDNEENLHYICDIFRDYRRAVATEGLDGLRIAEASPPDLILLDIIMPKNDGFDIFKRLKQNENLKDIPVIFLTGNNNHEDIIEGLRIGAADYITKPFEKEELEVRVKNTLELKISKDKIKTQNEIMESLNLELNNFMRIATHDLKNSLLVVQGFLKIILQHYGQYDEKDLFEMLNDISDTGDVMYKILNNLSMIAKLESGEITAYPTEMDVVFLLNEYVNKYRAKAEVKNINIIQINKIRTPKLFQDYNLIMECIENLLSNAVKFSPEGSTIHVLSYNETINQQRKPKIVIEVEDNGPGIKESEQNLLFKKFSKTSAIPTNKELTTGLGLAVTKMICNVIDADVMLDKNHSKGAKFILKIPINHKN
ncbi:MAG: hybrid sensor histidine kinase/response regulator [Candidatus Kapabacteria bacterium]|nr:hybrid sensor histidine kinase/response regulator [Ignavibacteriota bacterium]MCW5885303.1 hybrid sensor histidine kinase/response regulator [Candidatus Kapabacteria bacterium]